MSRAWPSTSVTPHEETPARKASLLLRASGALEESSTKWWLRALLTARPTTPLERDRTVSTFASLMAASFWSRLEYGFGDALG